jgi:GTP pyrophosphokinase
MKEENVKEGKLMVELAIKNSGYSTTKLLDKKYITSLLEKYNFGSIEELLSSIGYGAYSAKVICGKLINIYKSDFKKQQEKIQLSHLDKPEVNSKIKDPEKSVSINGVGNLSVKFAKCVVL